MLPHELIVWAMTTGRWSGPFSFCGAADAEAPQEIDTSVMAAYRCWLCVSVHKG